MAGCWSVRKLCEGDVVHLIVGGTPRPARATVRSVHQPCPMECA